jgi:hypothetical protein
LEKVKIEERIKKTPSKKIGKKGIQRLNSDIFGADQVE